MASLLILDTIEYQDGYIEMRIGPILEVIAAENNKSEAEVVQAAKQFFTGKVAYCHFDPKGSLKITDKDQGKMTKLMMEFHLTQC